MLYSPLSYACAGARSLSFQAGACRLAGCGGGIGSSGSIGGGPWAAGWTSLSRGRAAGWQLRRARSQSVAAAAAASNGAAGQPLTIIHFNDVYNIEERLIEPVGGAARFTGAVRSFAAEDPLILFSGDCLNPSLMSAFTRGEQMVPILNQLGVKAAVVGNHDFDFTPAVLRGHLRDGFRFPWLLSNVLDVHTQEPLGGAERLLVLEWRGVRIGLMGLVEREWLSTIPAIEDSDITYIDFCQEGRRLAAELRAQGADVIIALTHMRTPNDLVLAANVPEIQLILGGHDHHYEVTKSAPHGTFVFKSGTDFREFSVIRAHVPEAPTQPLPLSYERVDITSDVPEDEEAAATVGRYQALIGTKMDEPLGWSHSELDARFDTVRRAESNVGNLFADILRIALGADAAFFNGGTIRSDQVHAAGQLVMRDFVSMLPFTDELVLLELSGLQLLRSLETGVGSWPKLEGRFLQVSGIRFIYNPDLPPGSRVLPGSVSVGGAPLDLERKYKVATKAYLRGGKDGFECLRSAPVLVDGETAPRLATLVQYLWMRIENLNEQVAGEWQSIVEQDIVRYTIEGDDSDGEEESGASGGAAAPLTNGSSSSTHSSNSSSSNGGSSSSTQRVAAADVCSTGREGLVSLARLGDGGSMGSSSESEGESDGEGCPPEPQSSAVLDALSYLEPCAHGLDSLYFYDPRRRKFGISPRLEGRIVRIGGAEQLRQPQPFELAAGTGAGGPPLPTSNNA